MCYSTNHPQGESHWLSGSAHAAGPDPQTGPRLAGAPVLYRDWGWAAFLQKCLVRSQGDCVPAAHGSLPQPVLPGVWICGAQVERVTERSTVPLSQARCFLHSLINGRSWVPNWFACTLPRTIPTCIHTQGRCSSTPVRQVTGSLHIWVQQYVHPMCAHKPDMRLCFLSSSPWSTRMCSLRVFVFLFVHYCAHYGIGWGSSLHLCRSSSAPTTWHSLWSMCVDYQLLAVLFHSLFMLGGC